MGLSRKIGDGISIPFKVKTDMKGPVYTLLNYVDFYQNHRAMVNSYSRRQLEDKLETDDELKEVCKGALTNAEMGKVMNWNNTVSLNASAIASPCGYMAKNFPMDEYLRIVPQSGTPIEIQSTGLIMPEEKEKYTQDWDVQQWVKVDSDRFINWMVI